MQITFARLTYICDLVESGVCTKAEVGARDIVTDGRGDDRDGNTELLVVGTMLRQLQRRLVGL